MSRVHANDVGARFPEGDFMTNMFKPGDIVRWYEKWGVCLNNRVYTDVPHWAWFDEDGEFIDQTSSVDGEISAPYRHDYGHIPDTVLARATAEKLRA